MKDRTIALFGMLEGIFIILAIVCQFRVGFYNGQIEDINNKINERNLDIIFSTNKLLFGGIMAQFNTSYVSGYINESYSILGSNQELSYDEALNHILDKSTSSYIQDDLIKEYVYDPQKSTLLGKRRKYYHWGLIFLLLALLLSISRGVVTYLNRKEETNQQKRDDRKKETVIKSKELLRLEWENHKTYTFAMFSGLLLIAFGVIANIDKMINHLMALLFIFIGFLALFVGFFVSNSKMRSSFDQLKRLIEEKERIKGLPKKKKKH